MPARIQSWRILRVLGGEGIGVERLTTWPRLKLGDDDGCSKTSEAYLKSVRRWGGVFGAP